MTENNNQPPNPSQVAAQVNPLPQPNPSPQPSSQKTFTEAEVNEIVSKRLARANQQKIEEAANAKIETYIEEVNKIKTQLEETTRQKELLELSTSTGVDVELLSETGLKGDALKAYAQKLTDVLPKQSRTTSIINGSAAKISSPTLNVDWKTKLAQEIIQGEK